MTSKFWEERYKTKEYIYGKEPNVYIKEKLDSLEIGKVLFPLEGEGRNVNYASEQGWEAFAFDQSVEAAKKAFFLAIQKVILIDYQIKDIESVEYEEQSFDVIGLCYAHFSEEQRKYYHQKMTAFLKVGGYLILEGFSKKHVRNQAENPTAGGPKDETMLFDLEELKGDFPNFEFIEAIETTVDLNEGEGHKGQADVVRIFAKKIK